MQSLNCEQGGQSSCSAVSMANGVGQDAERVIGLPSESTGSIKPPISTPKSPVVIHWPHLSAGSQSPSSHRLVRSSSSKLPKSSASISSFASSSSSSHSRRVTPSVTFDGFISSVINAQPGIFGFPSHPGRPD